MSNHLASPPLDLTPPVAGEDADRKKLAEWVMVQAHRWIDAQERRLGRKPQQPKECR